MRSSFDAPRCREIPSVWELVQKRDLEHPCYVKHMAVSVNWGGFLWVSAVIRALTGPSDCKLPHHFPQDDHGFACSRTTQSRQAGLPSESSLSIAAGPEGRPVTQRDPSSIGSRLLSSGTLYIWNTCQEPQNS